MSGPDTAPVEEADILVLGGGIVGVSVAIQLQLRGRQVLLADLKGPGEETSFGNAGLIQREGVLPYAFPRVPSALLRYALNRSIDASYHPAMLPRLVSPFLRYWHNSQRTRHLAIARRYAPLITHVVDDHLHLAGQAGAVDLLRPGGWTQAHQSGRALADQIADAELLHREFGIEYRALDEAALAIEEPHLRTGLAGGLRWTQPISVTDPHALTLAYAALFRARGGRIAIGDARGLARAGAGWRVPGEGRSLAAREVVIALGPWSPVVTRRLGYAPPIFVKRGYHMHFQPDGNAGLNNAVLDVDNGYMLAPMRQGIRLTTGAEFAHRDAPSTPVQLARAEPAARRLLPTLGSRLDAEPWKGARPCTPDMMPIIGPMPGEPTIWCAFGHAHHGLTLGPTTGRLLAEMMTGEAPFTDPTPYRADRF